MMAHYPRFSILMAIVAVSAGCTYTGGDIGDPIHRKFHWNSFVSGADIAASCDAAGPDRTRMVYNAIWGQQVRIYEWDTARHSLRVRVVGDGDLSGLDLTDPLGPWRAADVRVQLDGPAQAALELRLDEAGGFRPPEQRIDLPSRSYYWTAASCRHGRFILTAWTYPADAGRADGVARQLFAIDPGGASAPRPGPVPLDVLAEYDRARGVGVDWVIRIDPAASRP